MPFKWCIKADCQNNNRKVPQKEFISLPKGAYKRNKWLTLAGRNPEEIRRKSPVLWICEDHFDMENDFTNYHEYRFGNGKRLYKKYGMVPSKLVSEDKRAMLYHRNSRNFIDEPTNFECQYSNEDLDPIQGPLTTEDGIFTELLCFEDFTEAASLSPILTSSSSKHQTQDTNSGKQFSYSLDDKQRNFSSSEERNDISSDILRSTSFRRDIKENADPEKKMALEFPPDTTKLLSNLEKTVRHSVLNDRIDEHENAETNVVKMTDDEIDNALQNVNHDHGYVFIPSQYNIHQSILPDFSLKDYYYAIVSPQNLKNVSKNTKILDNFFRGKHNKQDDIKFNDNKIIDCAGIIPIFACNYCNLGYINETSILSHVQRKHTEQYLFKHKIHFVRGVRFVRWKKQDVIKNKENDSAENIPTSKCFCCEKEFYYNTDLLKHLQEQHVFDDDNNIRDWCIIRSHCGERYCNKKGFIEYLRTLQSENESTDCADSIPIFIRNCSLEYISKTALLSYIKNTHTEKNCDNIILQREYSQKEYKSEINLLNHVEKLHDVNKETDSAEVSKCEFYQKEFKLEINLLKHGQKQHFVNKETNSPENKSTLKCSDKEFCYKADLLNHIQEQHLDIQKQTQGVQEKSVNMLEGFQLQFQSFIASHCTKEKQDKLDSMKIKENSNIDEIIPTKKKKSERANEEQHLDIQKEPQGVQEEFTNMLEGYQVQSFIASETQEKRDKLENIKIKENSNVDEIIPTKKKKSERANEEQYLDIQKEPQGVQEEFTNISKFMNECMKIKENSNIGEIIPTIKCCCNKTFHFKNDWLFHCQEQHVVDDGNRNSKSFKCYHCGRILKSKYSFSKHVRKLQSGSESRVSADKRNFQCCDKEFLYKADLLSHIEEQHLDMQEEPQGVQEEFINMLEGYQFQSCIASETQEKRDKLDSIKIKENSNIDEIIVPAIKCCCKKIFQLKKDWILHCQEQHLVDIRNRNRKPFKCYHCGKIFKSKKGLSDHVRYHQTKLLLSIYNRVTADKRNFQNHIKNKNTVKETTPILKCKYCPWEFKSNRCMLKHVQREHGVDKYTDSSENESTLICDEEFSSKRYTVSHFQDRHLDIQEQPQCIQEDHLSKSSTQDASSDIQQESLDIKEESQDVQDEPLDIQQNSQDIQEEPLNIESEIFKCSKCPLSFLNEEEMSKHLKVIHGDLIDLYIGKLKSNRKDAKVNAKTSKSLDEKQDIYSGYNFAQLETEIKIEISDHLEDIDLPYEQQLGLNLMYNLDPDFSVNQYNIHTNIQDANDTELAKDTYTTETITDFNPGTRETEYLESKNYIPTQEELLDHMHELINTKAKLYADAKQALKTNCMQLEDPNTSYDKPFLNESELLDNIHGVYDKSEKKQFNLEIVGENRIEVEENGSVKPVDPSVCRCCSKRLPIKIKIGKYDKICIKCKRIEKRNEKRRNSVKADFKSGTCENKPKNMSDAEILKNMNKFLNKRLKKMNRSSNRSKTNCVDDKIDVKKETLEGAFIFEDNDNDLLKPLREEEEKIIVQPHDPKLCKSCLVPLEVTESTGQNKTIKILCDKCKASETHNEKRRKSNEKRRKSNGNKIDKTFSKRNSELSCLICRCKFRNKLALRNHVARSHL